MQQSAITWPEGFVPGLTDNYSSNEAIVAGLKAEDIWPLLTTPSIWPSYYKSSSKAGTHTDKESLELGSRFWFETFGLMCEGEVTEYVAPENGQTGRVSWRVWAGEKEKGNDIECLSGWIVEDLDQGRVRCLSQETQNGSVAKHLASQSPNPLVLGHQQWLDGMFELAKSKKA